MLGLGLEQSLGAGAGAGAVSVSQVLVLVLVLRLGQGQDQGQGQSRAVRPWVLLEIDFTDSLGILEDCLIVLPNFLCCDFCSQTSPHLSISADTISEFLLFRTPFSSPAQNHVV